MRRSYFLVSLSFVALMVACSPSASSSQAEESGEPSAGAPSDAAASQAASQAGGGGGGGGGLASVDVTITGGAKAGHYEAEITQGGCSTGLYGPNSFTVASTAVEPAGSFGGAHVTIYDADGAAAGTDEEFSAAFPFDNFAVTVEVNPYLDLGTGTATLDNQGSTATVTIVGTSSDGDQVDATIECHTVTNL